MKNNRGTLWLRVGFAAWVFLYGWLVLVPAGRSVNTFASYYTGADVVWRTPVDASRLYDDDWFRDRIEIVGFKVSDIYRPNPPALGVVLGPLLVLPVTAAPYIWAGLNLMALIVGVAILLSALRVPATQLLWIVPLISISRPVVHHFARSQIYLLLFLVLACVYRAVLRERPKSAGVGLGLMLATKICGVWLFAVLIMMRQRRLIGWALLAAMSVAVSSVLLFGMAPWAAHADVLLYGPHLPYRSVTAYQTVASLFGQLFVFDATWNRNPVADLPVLADVMTGSLLVITLFLTVRTALRWRDRPDGCVLSTAMCMALMVSNSAIAEEYHYVLLIPSVVTAVWWAQRMRVSVQAWGILVLSLFLLAMPIPFKSPLLTHGWLALLAFPRVYGAYVLWLWLLMQLSSEKKGGRQLALPPLN